MIVIQTTLGMVNGEQVIETKSAEQEVIETKPLPEVKPSVRPIVVEIIPDPKISEDEAKLLARCVMAEAGNQGEEGQRLVTACILNRVDNEKFPNSITGVITQKGQFASYPKAMNKWTPSEEVYENIEKELENRSDTEVLYFRTGHYHKGLTPLFKVKDHYFSK